MTELNTAIDHRSSGARIEAAARDYLIRAGLRWIASNVLYRHGELDLVMLDDTRGSGHPTELVFVEVRYRRTTSFGGGAMSINTSKRRKLLHAAQAFLQAHREFAKTACRFDVIDASGDPEHPDIAWLRDAFRADDA